MAAHLEIPIARLFDFINSGDDEHQGPLTDETVVTLEGARFAGRTALLKWRQSPLTGAIRHFTPIACKRHNGAIVVTTITSESLGGRSAILSRHDWHLEVKGITVTSIGIAKAALQEIPEAVCTFLEAIAVGDITAVVSAFASDARVNDQLDEYVGEDEIRNWAIADLLGVKLQIKPLDITSQYSCTILTAEMDGEFDKRGLPDPLIHKMYFTVSLGKIVLLVILRADL